jgi:hypothetical protein
MPVGALAKTGSAGARVPASREFDRTRAVKPILRSENSEKKADFQSRKQLSKYPDCPKKPDGLSHV